MGGGAVAIWHDIVPEGLDEFHAWHGEEHMPERVAIPGFRRGRRFVAIDADLGYFNLYDTDSPEVVRGPEYKARLDNPSPRTLSAVRHFRNVARALCRVVATASPVGNAVAQGGLIATLRIDCPESHEGRCIEAITQGILPNIVRENGVAAAMLLVADRSASGYVNAEQRARGTPNLVPPIVLVAEGWADEQQFLTVIRHHCGSRALIEVGLSDGGTLGFYRHQLTVTRS